MIKPVIRILLFIILNVSSSASESINVKNSVAPGMLNAQRNEPSSEWLQIGEGLAGNLSFRKNGAHLMAYDEATKAVSSPVAHWPSPLTIAAGASFNTGFDYDSDGYMDVAVFTDLGWQASCNGEQKKPLHNRNISVYSGHNKILLYEMTLLDNCHQADNGVWIGYDSVVQSAFNFGAPSGQMVISPQYHTQGWHLPSQNAFYTPNSETFTWFYNNDTGYYSADSLPLAGLVVNHGGLNKYITRSSHRFSQYDTGPLTKKQLLSQGNLSSVVPSGRTYGLFEHDINGSTNYMILVSGASVRSLYNTFLNCRSVPYNNKIQTACLNDVWGGLERHVSFYNLSTNASNTQYYGYAHSNNEGNAYVNRIEYPGSTALAPSVNPFGSKILYNVFTGLKWSIHIAHITSSGTVEVPSNLDDYYLWDIIPRGNDEVDLVVSPIDKSTLVQVPSHINYPKSADPDLWVNLYYFPKWETRIYRWKKGTQEYFTKDPCKTISDAIPHMQSFSYQKYGMSSEVSLFRTVRALDYADRNKAMLIMRTEAGDLFESELPISCT